MFGQNEIVGRKTFAGRDDLLVTSIFLTHQGEGPFAGRPAVFIRLAKCNLDCPFCDTYFDTGDDMTVTEVIERVFSEISFRYTDRTPFDMTHRIGVVITGGEPTLQPKLGELCRRLKGAGLPWVQIETNGILHPGDLGFGITVVVSPKVNAKNEYIKPHAILWEQASCMKFVLSADPKSPYHEVPKWAHEWSFLAKKPVYVSPMNVYKREPLTAQIMRQGRQPTMAEREANEIVSFWDTGLLDMEANRANHEYAGKYALDHGLLVSLQMHLMLGVA